MPNLLRILAFRPKTILGQLVFEICTRIAIAIAAIIVIPIWMASALILRVIALHRMFARSIHKTKAKPLKNEQISQEEKYRRRRIWALQREFRLSEADTELPLSSRLDCLAFRWHDPKHLYYDHEFFRTFEDGPWKWAAQGRFAGRNLNCGHYFGLSEEAATWEADYYGIQSGDHILLEQKISSERILDLTRADNIEKAYRLFRPASHPNHAKLLQELIAEQKGGNRLTDTMGIWAKQQGYDGILFFSARAIERYRLWLMCENENLAAWQMHETVQKMALDLTCINLVVFDGAWLVSSISEFKVNGTTHMNPHFRANPKAVRALSSQWDENYQEQQRRVTIY